MPLDLPILLVDDDHAWIDLIAYHLEQRGLTTLRASSPKQAAPMIEENELRAVISDLEMPGEDGWSFRKRIRRIEGGKKLPFIFLSSETRTQGRALPRPFLSKSLPLKDICDAILKMVGTPQVQPAKPRFSRFRSAVKKQLWQVRQRSHGPTRQGLNCLAAGTLLVLLSPLFLLIGLAIRIDSRGPVFFIQRRVGRDGRTFRMLKFRSMRTDAEDHLRELAEQNDHADSITFKMKNDPRTTKVGRWLRRSSMDELPQLWNVLTGSMTLVGPRPPTPTEVDQYGFEAWLRLGVTPGLTGLWQVSGRADLPFPRQLELDRQYIQDNCILNDLKILVATIPAILTGRGAY